MATGFRLHFDFIGETQVDRTLTGFEDRAADARPAWEELRRRFLAVEARQFASEGGGSWPALSPPYAAWKATHYPGRPIMVREGDLRRSLTVGPEVTVMEPSFAIFGTAVPYAEFHQHGTGRLPRRRVVDLPESEKREWVRILQRWLVGEGR